MDECQANNEHPKDAPRRSQSGCIKTNTEDCFCGNTEAD